MLKILFSSICIFIGMAKGQSQIDSNQTLAAKVDEQQNILIVQGQALAICRVEMNSLHEKMEMQAVQLKYLKSNVMEKKEVRMAGSQIHGAIWTSIIGGGLIGFASVIQYSDPYRVNNTALMLNIAGLGFYCISIYKAYNSGTHLIAATH